MFEVKLFNRPEIVNHLGIEFKFERRALKKNQPQEFKVLVEANVVTSNDRILAERHSWNVAYMRANRRNTYFFWEPQHCINCEIHKYRQIRLYKVFNTESGRDAINRMADRLVTLIAPNYYRGPAMQKIAERLFNDAYVFLVCHNVMNN